MMGGVRGSYSYSNAYSPLALALALALALEYPPFSQQSVQPGLLCRVAADRVPVISHLAAGEHDAEHRGHAAHLK